MGRGNFEGEEFPIAKYRDTLRSSVQKRLNRSRCCLSCELGLAYRNRELDGVQIPQWERAILGKKSAHCKVWATFLPSAVQKRLKRSICRLGLGGPKEARVESYSPGGTNVHKFDRIRQVSPMCPTTLCRELCNKCSAAAEMGDRLATIDMQGIIGEGAVPLYFGGS